MSGRGTTDSRLSRTGSGPRSARFDGLPLDEYQRRELRRILDDVWPRDTVRAAARDLGEPVQTVRNWYEGLTFPGGLKLLRLGRHIGLQNLARLDPDPDSELQVAAAIMRRQMLEQQLADVTARLAGRGA